MSEKIQGIFIIADWVRGYGWMACVNQDGCSVFQSYGSNALRGLMITKNGYNLLLEVKGFSHLNILGGSVQRIRFWGLYCTGLVKYEANWALPIDSVFVLKFRPYGYFYVGGGGLQCLDSILLQDFGDVQGFPVICLLARVFWRQWHNRPAVPLYEEKRTAMARTAFKPPLKTVVGVLVSRPHAISDQVLPFVLDLLEGIRVKGGRGDRVRGETH